MAATEGRAKYNAFSGESDRDIYKGLTFWSPNINIFRDPRWGRGQETYGEPCCGSRTLIQEILRGEWGFKGHFVSDCWAIRDFHENHMVTHTMEESAALALKNGCDRIPYEKVECEEHLALADQMSKEAVVLLKNDGVLPLRASAGQTVGVIGPNANSREALVGNYHGTSSRYITVLEGIQDKVGHNGRVLFSEGSHLFKDRVEDLALANDRIAEAAAVLQLW